MSANLDRICTVDIVLDSPISDNANFDNILILGPAPKSNKVDMPMVGVYNSLTELTELGIKATGADADPIGVAARVAFSQSPRPHEVYVACIGEVADDEQGIMVQLTPTQVLEEAMNLDGWYCICPVGLSPEEVKEVIQWTETQTKLCGYPENDPEHPVVQPGTYFRSFPVFTKETEGQAEADIPPENQYGLPAAMAVKAMYYHAGSETWANKQLASVYPAKLRSAFIGKLEGVNASFVLDIASKTTTQGGKTNAGEWIDVIRFRDWQQADMQLAVANQLILSPKIPYTDAGISTIENQMRASLSRGQQYGGIAPTEFSADGAAIPGFVTSVPLASSITSSQKATRVLSGCQFSARLAGAVHMANIEGNLTYENL